MDTCGGGTQKGKRRRDGWGKLLVNVGKEGAAEGYEM